MTCFANSSHSSIRVGQFLAGLGALRPPPECESLTELFFNIFEPVALRPPFSFAGQCADSVGRLVQARMDD